MILNNLRYIINNLDYELVQEMEKMNPGALNNLCTLYSVNLQLQKERRRKNFLEFLGRKLYFKKNKSFFTVLDWLNLIEQIKIFKILSYS